MNVAYLHTADYHPAHESFANAVSADFIRIDEYLHYYHDKKQYRLKRYLSWVLTIIFFSRKYDVILTDEENFVAVGIKATRFFKKVKLISNLCGTGLNYTLEGKRPLLSTYLILQALKYYDGLIAVGDIQYSLALKTGYLSQKIKKVYVGITDERLQTFSMLTPEFTTPHFVSICNLNPTFFYVKGIDIMAKVFTMFLEKFPTAKYTIVGGKDIDFLEKVKDKYSDIAWDKIEFLGHQNELTEILKKANILLQLSRYDSFGITVVEAAVAGLPTFVSDQVGAKIILEGLTGKEDYIIENENISEAIEKIEFFWRRESSEKQEVSLKMKKNATKYTEKNACEAFKTAFYELVEKIN